MIYRFHIAYDKLFYVLQKTLEDNYKATRQFLCHFYCFSGVVFNNQLPRFYNCGGLQKKRNSEIALVLYFLTKRFFLS